jgi:histidinol-phosphate aminotransferase
MSLSLNKRLWNERTKKLIPYEPGEQPSTPFIKLNTNENPYPPSSDVLRTLRDIPEVSLRKYPDPTGSALRETIAFYYDLDKNHVFLGNGSDEVLALAFQAFFDLRMPVAFPDITYSFYPVYARAYEIPFHRIPLKDDFTVAVNDYFDFEGGVVLANPNAPTGILTPKSDIEKLLDSNINRVVIVDEAYIDFGGESCVDLIRRYKHLLVVQTLSKSRALAGLRVGYAMGDSALIRGLECVRDSFNSYTMDSIALTLACKAFEDGTWFEITRQKIIDARQYLTNRLFAMGFTVLPSSANFVFTSHEHISAVRLYERLRENGILVRYFNKERIDRFLRITVGTMEDMHKLVHTIQTIVNEELKL